MFKAAWSEPGNHALQIRSVGTGLVVDVDALLTLTPPADQTQVGSTQYDWLLADLNAHPHRCVAAYWHRPIFSTGPHGPSKNMLAIFQLLYDQGVDLVLVGHDHTYERFAKARPDGTADPVRGVRQIVIGTGGAALYSFTATSPLTEAREQLDERCPAR